MIGRATLATVLVALMLTTAGCTGLLPAPSEPRVEGTATDATSAQSTDATTAAATTAARTSEERGRANLTFVSQDGTELANVSAVISDSEEERYTGLSDTESLGPNEGMLFVYEQEGHHAYVMREMDFPLDIIYVAADGTITKIHHAPLPPEDAKDLKLYEGDGQYVVEVNHNFTVEHNVSEGDTIEIER